MTKAIYSYLLPISVIFFPLITHFLLSSIISEKKKYISQIENLPLEQKNRLFTHQVKKQKYISLGKKLTERNEIGYIL